MRCSKTQPYRKKELQGRPTSTLCKSCTIQISGNTRSAQNKLIRIPLSEWNVPMILYSQIKLCSFKKPNQIQVHSLHAQSDHLRYQTESLPSLKANLKVMQFLSQWPSPSTTFCLIKETKASIIQSIPPSNSPSRKSFDRRFAEISDVYPSAHSVVERCVPPSSDHCFQLLFDNLKFVALA